MILLPENHSCCPSSPRTYTVVCSTQLLLREVRVTVVLLIVVTRMDLTKFFQTCHSQPHWCQHILLKLELSCYSTLAQAPPPTVSQTPIFHHTSQNWPLRWFHSLWFLPPNAKRARQWPINPILPELPEQRSHLLSLQHPPLPCLSHTSTMGPF